MTEAAFSLVPKPGEIIAGKYRVESVLGSGGMGIVLSATHVALDERVALKLLRPEAARRGDSARRFLREARAAIKIRSEHVARVHDVGTLDSGAHYIVMEHLTGSDLARHLDDQGPLPIEDAVTFVLMTCEAVAEAHALGIVHRDLKPSNLFLCKRADGSPCIKVLDFGVSKFKMQDDPADGASVTAADSERPPPLEAPSPSDSASTTAGITATSARIGSPRYMAPEQMVSARDVDARADIWALGAILFELVAGRPAFDAADVPSVEDAVRAGRFPKLRNVRPGVSQVLDAAVSRCLSVDREARFANVGTFALAISALASPDGVTAARRAARVCDVVVEEPRTRSRSRMVAIGGGLAIGGIITAFAMTRTPTAGAPSVSAPISAAAIEPPPPSLASSSTPLVPTASASVVVAPAKSPPRLAPRSSASASTSTTTGGTSLRLDAGNMFDQPH